MGLRNSACIRFCFLSALLCLASIGVSADLRSPDPDDEEAQIRACLYKLNEVMATKDMQKAMSIFDTSNEIAVVGSDSGEVFVGRKRVEEFMKFLLSRTFVFSFEMEPMIIGRNGNTAWIFVDGKMIRTMPTGKAYKQPYRITAVMVKADNEWKWKIFSGSIPRGE